MKKSSNKSDPIDFKTSNPKEVVTSNELDPLEELHIKIETLVELLSDKGIINKKAYINNVIMRIHESSKAKSFDDLEET